MSNDTTSLFIHFITIIAICTLFLTDNAHTKASTSPIILKGQSAPTTLTTLLTQLATKHSLHSLLDYPCNAHIPLSLPPPPLTVHICVEQTSASLAAAHARLPRSPSRTFLRFDPFHNPWPHADLLFAWRLPIPSDNSTRHISALLPLAQSAGLRMAVFQAFLPASHPFRVPSIPIRDMAFVQPALRTAPFPHPEALVAASLDFHPTLVLLVYHLPSVQPVQ